MIRLSVQRVKAEEEPTLRKWMAELNRRKNEVVETFVAEGTRHEQAYLLKTSDGPILIYAMEAPNHEAAAAAFKSSTAPVDIEHKQLMKQVLAGKADVELLYECIFTGDEP
jgi:hypothetical protein